MGEAMNAEIRAGERQVFKPLAADICADIRSTIVGASHRQEAPDFAQIQWIVAHHNAHVAPGMSQDFSERLSCIVLLHPGTLQEYAIAWTGTRLIVGDWDAQRCVMHGTYEQRFDIADPYNLWKDVYYFSLVTDLFIPQLDTSQLLTQTVDEIWQSLYYKPRACDEMEKKWEDVLARNIAGSWSVRERVSVHSIDSWLPHMPQNYETTVLVKHGGVGRMGNEIGATNIIFCAHTMENNPIMFAGVFRDKTKTDVRCVRPVRRGSQSALWQAYSNAVCTWVK